MFLAGAALGTTLSLQDLYVAGLDLATLLFPAGQIVGRPGSNCLLNTMVKGTNSASCRSGAVEGDRVAHFIAFAKGRQSIADYLSSFKSLFPYVHDRALTADYRLARGRLKKVRDESAVVAHFLQNQDLGRYSYVQQNFGNDIPDAWLWTDTARIDIEITVALAEMRLAIAERLNAKGASPGFLPDANSDDLPAYRAAAEAEPRCYTTERYVDILYQGVIRRIRIKSRSVRRGYLLIDCPIGERFASAAMVDQLVQRMARDLPASGFDRIYLVDTDRIALLRQRD